jgi:hypothetical protein
VPDQNRAKVVRMCGPHPPTPEDLAEIDRFAAFLEDVSGAGGKSGASPARIRAIEARHYPELFADSSRDPSC